MSDITEEERSRLREAFDLFDKNNDGVISKNEIGNVIRQLGKNPTEEEVQAMIQEADLDNSETIDFEEFLHLIQRRIASLRK